MGVGFSLIIHKHNNLLELMDIYHNINDWSIKLSDNEDVSGWKFDVEELLANYGFDAAVFLNQVRSFYFLAQDSYFWRESINAIAVQENVNLNNEKDYAKLLRRIADCRWFDRGTRCELETGERDPVFNEILTYFVKSDLDLPSYDKVQAVRVAIADTVNYIRIFPAVKGLSEIPTRHLINPDVPKFWEEAARHVYYRSPPKKPRHDLNLHAVLSVQRNFPQFQWANPHSIGITRRIIEDQFDIKNPLFGPWSVFKYATLEKVQSSNKPTTNPHRDIWNKSHQLYAATWSTERGSR